MFWNRALAVWLVLRAAEVVHGALRALLLVPAVGDFRARQAGVFTGSPLVLGLTCLLPRGTEPGPPPGSWPWGCSGWS